jgi:hypothetical protein
MVIPILNADTAPYDSPNYETWRDAAFADVSNSAGTFVTMRSGTYPGSNDFVPMEAIVFGWNGSGQRLQWIYWIADATVADLTGKFQVKDAIDWDGVAKTFDDKGNLIPDGPDVGWFAPQSWIDYANPTTGDTGVIGTFGDAWVAALPADVYPLAVDMAKNQTYWTGEIRLLINEPGEPDLWAVQELKLDLVPEPITMAGLMLGIGSIAGYVRRRRG